MHTRHCKTKINLKTNLKTFSFGPLIVGDVSTKIGRRPQDIVCWLGKTGYYLELLNPQIMKLLGSTKSKLTKNENGEQVPNLEICQ